MGPEMMGIDLPWLSRPSMNGQHERIGPLRQRLLGDVRMRQALPQDHYVRAVRIKKEEGKPTVRLKA